MESDCREDDYKMKTCMSHDDILKLTRVVTLNKTQTVQIVVEFIYLFTTYKKKDSDSSQTC